MGCAPQRTKAYGFTDGLRRLPTQDHFCDTLSTERRQAGKHAFDICDRPTLALGICEVGPIVSQYGTDLVRDRFDEMQQEVSRDPPCGLWSTIRADDVAAA